jgi:hypothetical protein
VANKILGTAFVSIEAKTDKFLASAQSGISKAATKLGGVFQKPLVDAAGKAGQDAGKAFAAGIGGLAVAGGLALIGRQITHFALSGVDDFVNLGKAVERFSTVAGVSADTASRFIAVADDFGVAADTASQTIGFLAKTLGNNSKALDEFGISLVKAKDGSTDLAATSFAVIDAYNAMTDESRKAALGAAAFGRGYQALIPILNEGSEAIQKAFAGVSGSQVFDDSKVAKAKALGVTMDDIHDSVLDLQLALADGLAPALTNLASLIDKTRSGFAAADKATGGAATDLAKIAAVAGTVGVAFVGVASGVRAVSGVIASVSGSFSGFGFAVGAAAKGLGLFALAIASADIANKLTADVEKATRALSDLQTGLAGIGKNLSGPEQAQATLELLVRKSQEVEQAKGGVQKFFDVWHSTGVDFTQVVDNAQLHLLALKEAIDRTISTDPGSIPVLRQSLIQYAQAADAGDQASRDFLDGLGLTNDEIDKLIVKLNGAAVAQGKQSGATKAATVDLQDLDPQRGSSDS